MENQEKITIIACSGASNTGKYADEVARRKEDLDNAKMACLPKVAIGDKSLIEKLKSKDAKIVVIDGCPVNCASKILEKVGIEGFVHLNTTDFDIKKGISPVTTEKVDEIIGHIKSLHFGDLTLANK